MKLKIYSKENVFRIEANPSDSSVQKCALIGGSVNLTFTSYEFAQLDIKDYIDVFGQRYWLKKAYRPTMKSESEYKYNVIFYDQAAFTEDAVVLKLVDGEDSPEFALDDTPQVHLQLIVDNINRIMGTGLFVIGEVVTGARLNIEYNKTYCLDALNNLASLCETEVWVEGYTVNLSRAEHGSPITLGYGQGLINLSVKDNETAKFYTRLIPLGSTRNIDYSHYGYTRLQLPDGLKWLEKNLEYGIKEHVEEEAFSGIYPRYTGTITSVRTEEVTIDDVKRTIYYFKDTGMLFNPGEYEIAGLVKQITFQSGELNGRDFEANWHADAGEWEIINQYPYENQQLPGGALIPKAGDNYIPWNFRMPDEYYPAAEQEFYEAVEALLNKNSIDTSVYAGDSDYVHFEKEDINPTIGRRVTLISALYFDTGERNSRIISYNRKLNNPTQYYLEFSDSTSVGRLETIENDVDTIKAAISATPDSTELTLVRTWDNRDLSDYNVLSSLRSVKEIEKRALSRLYDDVAMGIMSFGNTIKSLVFTDGMDGKGWQITTLGEAILDSVRVRNDIYAGGVIGSASFAAGFAGWGDEWSMKTSTLTTDNIFARKNFTAYTITYSQIFGIGGNQVVSDINKIASVEKMSDRFRCYMDDMDGLMLMNLRVGDGARIQNRIGVTSIKYLVGRVINVASDYFDIDINLLDGSGSPEAGDFVLRWGNNIDATRQGLIYLTSADQYAPFLAVYDGITGVSTEGKLKVQLGNIAGIRLKNNVQLSGHGFYGKGLYIEDSQIFLDNGFTIEQNFSVMDGKLESEISAIRNDMSLESGNILRNSTFSDNTYYWNSSDDISVLNVGGSLLWFNANFYADKRSVADIYRDGSRNVLRILNTKIYQKAEYYQIDNELEEGVYSWSLYYKVIRPGTLRVGIPESELYEELVLNEVMTSYRRLDKVAAWSMDGDFEISFTGEILIYGVSLFPDSLAASLIKMQTEIYQNKEQIALRATKSYVDSETGRITSSFQSELSITAAQIEASVKSWTNGQLTNYSTVSQTSNSIQAAVNDLNMGQYATTTWASNRITNAVSGLTTWAEVKTKLTQTSESFTIAVQHIHADITSVTEAFYKFNASRMYANRRIEVGSGSQSSFVASAGISPYGSNNIAFWAGGTWDQAVARESAVLFNHTGGGYLAKRNIEWTQAGDLTMRGRLESNSSGDRIIINPVVRNIVMIATDKTVATLGFSSDTLYKGADFRLYLYDYSGSLLGRSVFGGGNMTLWEGTNEDWFLRVSGGTKTHFEINNLPTSRAQAYVGELYLDGETIKRKNSN